MVPCRLRSGDHKDALCLQDGMISATAFTSFSLLLAHACSWADKIQLLISLVSWFSFRELGFSKGAWAAGDTGALLE